MKCTIQHVVYVIKQSVSQKCLLMRDCLLFRRLLLPESTAVSSFEYFPPSYRTQALRKKNSYAATI